MLDKLISKSLKVFTLVSSTVTMIGFGLSIQDTKLKEKYFKLQERNEILEKQINDLKIDELKNEVIKNKVEYYRTSLEESHNKIIKEVETIQNLEVKTNESKEILNSHLDKFNIETENMHNIISDVLKYFDKNKFLNDNNIIDFFTNYINNLNKFLSSLSFEQYGAIAHLTSAICILIFLFSIISILFADSLINYFNLTEKYPKLSKILKIRSKFNNLSLFISFTVIIFNLLLIIYVNLLILINFS